MSHLNAIFYPGTYGDYTYLSGQTFTVWHRSDRPIDRLYKFTTTTNNAIKLLRLIEMDDGFDEDYLCGQICSVERVQAACERILTTVQASGLEIPVLVQSAVGGTWEAARVANQQGWYSYHLTKLRDLAHFCEKQNMAILIS